MFINKSLSFLEQTVNALSKSSYARGSSTGRRGLGDDSSSASDSASSGGAFVPFRQSKLTSVLKDALGGNCKTVMIGNSKFLVPRSHGHFVPFPRRGSR